MMSGLWKEAAMSTAITVYLALLCVLMAVAIGIGVIVHRGWVR